MNMTALAQDVELAEATISKLSWLDGGKPHIGRIARILLRSQEECRLLENIPADVLLPASTIFECIAAAAAINPMKSAITHLNAADNSLAPRIVTYADLKDQMIRAANMFVAMSQDAPVCVATILPMVPEALVASWAAVAVGTIVPINPFLEMNYVVSIMNSVGVTVLVAGAERFKGVHNLQLEYIVANVPTLRNVLLVGAPVEDNDFGNSIASFDGEASFKTVKRPDDVASYQLTGGTTGAPKLIRLTHRGQLINAWLNGALQGTSVNGAVGHAMPNFHIGGAVVVALRTIIFGQTLVTLTTAGFRNPGVVRHFWDIARVHRLTAVLATPTTASAILAVGDTSADGHCIEAFACGGSTVPLALSHAFHQRFGIWLREQWGLSEAQGTVTGHMLNDAEPLTGSIGYAFPYYKVKIVEVSAENEFLRECAAGERGVIAVAGCISPGYADERLNSQFFIKAMPDGTTWGNTGDLGSIDDDGYVWVFGRAKDLIVRGGHNIDPRIIEDVLCMHPAVQLAAAIGRPDALKGEMPIAYVQLKNGQSAASDDLIKFCKLHCQERAAVPVEIFVLDLMPTTAVGKISKPELRQDALRRTATLVAQEIVGADNVIEVAIKETGRRPTVMLTVSGLENDASTKSEALRIAFANFEFLTQISFV